MFGYLSIARLVIDDRAKALEMLGKAEAALDRSANLTSQLLTFAKGGQPIKRTLDLVAELENAGRFALSGSACECRFVIAEDLWPVEADPGQFGQVVQNIVLNAQEAMGGTGTVELRAENLAPPTGGMALLPAGRRYVHIAIGDTGAGIAGEHLSRIFDPYFTTKPQGSGLGLATSYSIIQKHGGVIEVESVPGQGSTFHIYLPASDLQPARKAPLGARPPAAPGKILVMDDEAVVRDVAVQLLESLGHRVDSAAEGREAINLYRKALEAGAPYDVVILDLTVKGGLGGEPTIGELLRIDPQVRAVVSSGYADSPVVAEHRARGFAAFINKPYRAEDLRRLLSELLDG